jgi:hypothetical protein
MARKPVFYSFHFANDVFRVQLVRNIGALEGNTPVSANEWEELKRKGDAAVERWIDDNMKYRQCVVVLIGSETANRRWVRHEILKAWNERRGVLGVYIHNLKCPRSGTCARGPNPFDSFTLNNGGQRLSSIVQCYDPPASSAYATIATNMEQWVDAAIAQRK